MSTKNWMKKLALHYERMRGFYPEDDLVIIFDIDGTILDMRHMVVHSLKSFDKEHDTHYFSGLEVSDIKVHENRVEDLLAQFEIHRRHRDKILDWYLRHRWSRTAVLESHRPFCGVMELIRWFQIQPGTHVSLNTGRPESIREETLRSLNNLGEEYKVEFRGDLLHMNPYGWGNGVADAKTAGVIRLQEMGYRVFAFVDNEPENLRAVSEINADGEILLLHADTIFESKRRKLPPAAASGVKYDITELVREKALPRHVQFVWHGVNDEANLRQFLSSNVQWAELDVRHDPFGNNIILRHDSFRDTPLQEDEDFCLLDDILEPVKKAGKAVKLDLKEGGVLIDKVFDMLEARGLDCPHLWFNGRPEAIGEDGFRRLSRTFPEAVIQCPVDFLYPLILSMPGRAREILGHFRGWGVNRFSINWDTPEMRKLLDRMDSWGFEVNVYNVPDLESFLKAVLLTPKSITSDFNFPKWHYYGRGSGENRRHHEYLIRQCM